MVRLRTIRLGARAGAHIECRCSRSRSEDVTITDVIIKTPDGKWDWGVNDVMPGSDGLGILVIFEKAVSWDSTLSEASWDLKLDEARPAVVYGMHRAFVGSHGTVSIVKIVSLSPYVEKLKVNKRFVPEQRKSSVFRDSYASVYFTYVCVTGAVLRSYTKDMTITICHNKPTDRKWGWSMDDVRPRRYGPENLRILKRRQLRHAIFQISTGRDELKY